MSFALTAGTLTFLITLVWGEPLISVLLRLKLGKRIRLRGAVVDRHITKEGTPTFGGILIILPTLAIASLLNAVNMITGTLQGRSILVALAGLVFFAVLGVVDDWEGIREKGAKGEGLSSLVKFCAQLVVAIGIALSIFFILDIHSIALPFVVYKINLGYWYLPIAVFIIVGTSNAANLTDGLDSLLGSVSFIAFAAYGIIASLQEQTWLATFSFIIVGCLLGFLWYNAHPARIFMGDTGSQAIGATLGIVALMTGQWLLLPIIGSVFVLETISVIVQKFYFWYSERYYGERRRIFKMAPIHHHFEVLGWDESQIVFRFMLISIISAMLGIALAIV